MFPHDGSVTVRVPSLLPGSGRPRSPALLRYYEPAKTPVTPLPALPLSVGPRYLELAPAISLHVAGKPAESYKIACASKPTMKSLIVELAE